MAVDDLWLCGMAGVGSRLSVAQSVEGEVAQYLVPENRACPCPLLLGQQDTM